MQSNEIRRRFLKFFENRGHKIIPSASLVPENDPSVLFNTAGMQPLVPYLLGQPHPMGKRLVNAQKCVRTQDIDEVGDNTHDTFFEMLGNWSLGDYFKDDAIQWSYEFLISKEEGLGLDPKRLYVTVFEGDENAPKDTEAFDIWKKYVPEHRIYYMGAKSNWWSVGDNGPCGPDTEMFYDVTKNGLGDLSKEEYLKADSEQKVVEIWNDVFMQFLKKDGKIIGQLPSQNVDTGSGLERIAMAVQGKSNLFETDLFAGAMEVLKNLVDKYDDRPARIVADHIRTSIFMITDGVLPSNTGRGYILRRLLRRAILKMRSMHPGEFNIASEGSVFFEIIQKFFEIYSDTSYLIKPETEVFEVIKNEELKFRNTLEQGLKEFESGTDPFVLFTTYGFPVELTVELGRKVNMEDFNTKIAEHQKLSQTSSAGMFKGGLANHNDKTIRLHTSHHLLLAGLQAIVSPTVKQRGSNITEERLRIDFLCDHKLTDEEKQKVEAWVNDKISKELNVVRMEMPLVEAEKIGAEMEFGAKYPEVVSVYVIEDEGGNPISKEFCGGPHVSNTRELGMFKIQKEEAVSAGVRRIKAVLG